MFLAILDILEVKNTFNFFNDILIRMKNHSWWKGYRVFVSYINKLLIN